jgi:hypothetical protein
VHLAVFTKGSFVMLVVVKAMAEDEFSGAKR